MEQPLQYYIDDRWDGTLPVNIEGMVTGFWNIQYHHYEHASISHDTITLPNTWGFTRQRYAIAYAVHAYAYHKKQTLSFTKKDFSITDARSKYLNHKTLDTLIPQHILKYVIGTKGVTTLQALSQLFGTSKTAISTQCRRAGIIY